MTTTTDERALGIVRQMRENKYVMFLDTSCINPEHVNVIFRRILRDGTTIIAECNGKPFAEAITEASAEAVKLVAGRE